MKVPYCFAVVTLFAPRLLLPTGVVAQDHTHHVSPYAGMEDRAIKALSPEEVEGLRNGAGMGFALSAELNGYPGPRHVLDMAKELELDAQQTAAVEEIQEAMEGEAVRLGEELLELEGELDRRFAHGHIDSAELSRLTGEIGRVRGELRAAHLAAHLRTREILLPEQTEAYNELRGYAHGG